MTSMLNGIFAALRFFKSRLFTVGVFVALLSVTVYATSASINTVYIQDDALQDTLLVHTTESDIHEILRAEGVNLEPEDVVVCEGFQGNIAEVYIDRAFDVSITADGTTKTVAVTGGTVREVMAAAGVEINNEDLISREPSEFVEPGDEIVINRVQYRTTQVQEEIPFEQEQRMTPLLRNGRVETLQRGGEGTLVKNYTERTIDGVVEEAVLDSQHVAEHPVTEVTLVGADVPVSDLDFGFEIVDNVPVDYNMVIEGARAAGYSVGGRGKGASGNRLTYGHVAVDPNEIPYNSKLYITSEDGSFIYGYAIASDTGVALMNGVIDVDLYYDTYRESQLNSIRTVNIYVLE